jgi:hypothetical protein
MHTAFVERRRWISEKRFLHALNYCMLLSAPKCRSSPPTSVGSCTEPRRPRRRRLVRAAVGAGVALFRFNVGVLTLLGASAALGLVASSLGT